MTKQQVLAAVRKICLGLPATSERLSHGAPTFFVRDKRSFAMVWNNHHGDGRYALICAAPEGMQAMLVETDPEYLNTLWRHEITALLKRMRDEGRIELLDRYLTSEGMTITQFPLLPRKK